MLSNRNEVLLFFLHWNFAEATDSSILQLALCFLWRVTDKGLFSCLCVIAHLVAWAGSPVLCEIEIIAAKAFYLKWLLAYC